MKRFTYRYTPFVLALLLLVTTFVMHVHAAEVTVLDAKIKLTDTLGNISVNNNGVTASAQASKKATTTNTITLINVSDSKAMISFSWSASKSNSLGGSVSCTVDGETKSDGTFSKALDPNETITITLVGKGGSLTSNTAKLELSNFSYQVVENTYDVTVDIKGSGTVKMDGNAITSGAANAVPPEGSVFTATASSGYTFVGWTDANYNLLSKSSSYTVTPTEAVRFQAVFAKNDSEAWFHVDDKYLVNGLNNACGKGTKVVLAHNGTLTGTDNKIPTSVSVLIPFNDSYTFQTTAPVEVDSSAAPSAFRTLTMANGASITIEGSLCVGGQQSNKQSHNGCPTGKQGYVKMAEGSTITVKNGGKLYAWGYIYRAGADNEGSVIAEGGSTIYECFQVKDWRGGDGNSQMLNNSQKVLPISQYYVQNIEVPLTLNAGASEYVYMSAVISKMGARTTAPFVGSSGLFRIGEKSSMIKDYDEETDRQVYQINGEVNLAEFTINVKADISLGSWTDVKMETKNYVLPLCNNITVECLPGSTMTVNSDVALLPGVEILIDKDATVKLTDNAICFIYDTDTWIGKGYVSYTRSDLVPLAHSPGKVAGVVRSVDTLQDAMVVVEGTMDASGGAIYTTFVLDENGAIVSDGATISGKDGGKIITAALNDTTTRSVTYQAYQYANEAGDQVVEFKDISVFPAWLHNADETHVNTADEVGTYTYYASTGRWDRPSHFYEDVVTEPTCTEKGYTTHTCAVCGDSYQDTPVDVLGHSYESTVTEPTCTKKGYTTYTCTRDGCTHSYTDNEVAANGHTPGAAATCTTPQTCTVCNAVVNAATGTSHTWMKDEAGKTVCSVCGTKFTFQASMAVNDSLDLIFSVRQSDVAGLEGEIVCTVTKEFADGRADVVQPFTFGKDTLDSEDGYYRFRFSDISAKEMMDNITAVISYKDGGTEIISCTTSVQGYVRSLYEEFKDSDYEKKEEMFTALADLLNYGAACQTHFGYDADNLANAGIDGLMAKQTPASGSAETQSTAEQADDSYYYGTSFSAKNNLMFTFYYDFKGEIKPEEIKVSAQVIITDGTGVLKTDSTDSVNWYKRTSGTTTLYGIDITGIPLSRGDVVIICTLSVDGEPRSTVSDSLADYTSRAPQGTLRTTMEALLRFTESAKTYFS